MTQLKIAIACLWLSACTTLADSEPLVVATAALRTGSGTPAGTANITSSGRKLSLTIAASGLTEGTHGIHLHMVGICEGPAFTTAGGHLNPLGKQHGSANPAGSHLGDLPNLVVANNGTGTLSAQLDGMPSILLREILDSDGTAVVIHASPDDYRTDPSGNSGTRVACGVFKPT